jgi:hypothetical protein
MSPVDTARAYEKLERILAQRQYQEEEYISPIIWLFRALDRFSEWFSSLGLVVQIIVLAVLVGILVAILVHFILVFVRVLRTPGARPGVDRAVALRVGDLPGSSTLIDDARAALEAGNRAGALRLYYLAALARLRERRRIPMSTALTGREILASTRPPLPGLGEATWLFERCVYGTREPATDDVACVRKLAEEIV